MGQRGPAPTPSSVKRRRGTFRRDRAPKNEPHPGRGRPRCPQWLSAEAKRAWRQIVPELENMRVLTRADRNALARYVQLWSRWREAEQHIQDHGAVVKSPAGYPIQNPHVSIAAKLAGLLSRLESEFGLTPSARTRIEAMPEPAATDDALQELIDGNPRGRRGAVIGSIGA